MAVQNFENLDTFTMLVGKRTLPVPHNIIENYPTSFARNSVFDGPNDFIL